VLVERLLEKLAELGYTEVETKEVTSEDVTFSLPPWLRSQTMEDQATERRAV
jgi:hypothetical protein